MQYKLVIAPTPDRLELLVNEFLKSLRDDLGVHTAFKFLGNPQVFGHEEYIQAIEVYR